MKRLLFIFLGLACFGDGMSTLNAQESWPLEKCIAYAQESNLTIKQAKANVRASMIAEQQAKTARLPNLSASANLGEQFGRTIDPTTNTFRNEAIAFNSFGLNAGISLFNGGLIHNQVKQAAYDLKAAESDAKNTELTLGLQVAQAYLVVLLSEEQLEAAQRRVELSQRQLTNTQKLVEAGSVPLAERLNIEAQISRDEQSAITAVNNLELAFLNLKQLLQLEPDFPLEIVRPEFTIPADANPDAQNLPAVYAIAESQQPSVQAADYRLESAKVGVKVAQSAYWPSISGFANLTTNYSSQFNDFGFTGETVLGDPRPVVVNGSVVAIQEFVPVTFVNAVPYFDQLDQNFGQGIGVSMNVPIYQNGRTRLNVERARLNIVNAELQSTQARQQLKNDIQTALANARAGKRQLAAAEKAYNSFKTAYENTEKRQTLGAANSLDLVTAKTNLDNAENDLLVARYDYLFRLKILDFYLGKPLTLN
ncbi:MAG: TolC family protein [Saprospiraceae bacterium]|nr:TolC family protein [Saprospiraceae bacterium]